MTDPQGTDSKATGEAAFRTEDHETVDPMLESLEVIASISRSLRTASPDHIFAHTLHAIRAPLSRFLPLQSLCFVVPTEDNMAFEICECDPESDRQRLTEELDFQIDSGKFGWAMNQSRVVITPSLEEESSTLLHTLSGRTRVMGMLMGLLSSQGEYIPDVERKLVSIALLHATSTLEAATLQLELRENNSQLESRVEKRTSELRKMRDVAESANQAKSGFLATISHELRTPMNGVLGMAQILSETEMDPQQEECSRLITTSAERLLALINEILDFSKLEAGRVELEQAPFCIRDTVEGVADLLTGRAASKGVALTVFVSEGVPVSLLGDANRIGQILTNLAGNAIKFTASGTVSIRVTRERVQSSANLTRLCFEVEDSGIGMSSKDQQALFQPYTQADITITRRFGGTGLGLAISRGLSDLMGGKIGVDSHPGEGSRFWFRVDLSQLQSEESSPPSFHSKLAQKTIVIAVPNAAQSQDLAQYCLAWGMHVEGEHELDPVCFALEEMSSPGVVIAATQWEGDSEGKFTKAVDAAARRGVLILTLAAPAQAGQPDPTANAPGAVIRQPIHRNDFHDSLCRLLGLLEAKQSAPAGTDKIEEASSAELKPLTDRLLLLVEDNFVNQRVAKRMLERLGAQIEVAANGAEAVECAKERDYDAILMDCQMPTMDGYTATRLIRENQAETGRHVPIVAMTANAIEGDREKCLQSGMDDYLTKPIRISTLRDMLLLWITEKTNP